MSRVQVEGNTDMHSDPQLEARLEQLASRRSWLAFGVVAIVASLVPLALWQTAASMVQTWREFEPYQHGFFVFPAFLYLVWRKRDVLLDAPARTAWPGVAALLLLGAVWLVARLGGAQVVSQAAMVAMIGAAILALKGWDWLRALAFPLGFLFFAVPFGEWLIPKLMDMTATFTVAALRLSGIPVYREGLNFVIPNGRWSVIEACSGIKFLIASLMMGSLYAYLMYQATRKRLIFVLVSLVVPILANWVRAYAIVLLGYLSNNSLMTGADHIAFGWVLFGAIMFVTYLVGARWQEPDARRPAIQAMPQRAPMRPAIVAVVLLAIIVWPLAELGLSARAMTPAKFAEAPLPAPVAGWAFASERAGSWSPKLVGQRSLRYASYASGPRRVDVVVAAFEAQEKGRELATSGNRISDASDADWQQLSKSSAVGSWIALPSRVRSESIQGSGGTRLVVWQWYVSRGVPTSSDLRGKLDVFVARATGTSDRGYWVAIAAPFRDLPSEAEPVLRSFVHDMDASLASSLGVVR